MRFLIAIVSFFLLWGGNADAAPRRLTIVQMNDVYEIFPIPTLENHQIQLRGGLAYASTLIQDARSKGPVLVLHAGDFLSPSLLSIKFKYKGAQMVDALNALGMDFVTFGNHEFDFGCDVLGQRIRQSNFEWISANVHLPEEINVPKGKVRPYRIKTIAGLRVGIFGVSLPSDPVGGCGDGLITMGDPFEAAKGAINALKRMRVDLIVALTHLPIADDRKLSETFPEIDFIVGGHDHEPIVEVDGRTLITKAGSNALDLGMIGISAVKTPDGWLVEKNWNRIPVDPVKGKSDPAVVLALKKYSHELQSFDRVIGSTEVPLDVREGTVREKESNFGSYLADLMRQEMKTDIALINAGAFRGDRVLPPGSLTLGDIYTILLFENQLRAVDITGEQILRALENGVSEVGERAGRFPQVSGLTLVFDHDKPPGQRILRVKIGDKLLEPLKVYTMATIDFLIEKGSVDGYTFPKQNLRAGGSLNEMVIRSLGKGPLRCEVDGRIMEE